MHNSFTAKRSIIEQLESRTHLSAGGTPDPSFGTGGILTGFEVLGIQSDGKLIATRPNGSPALLNPDGTFFGAYTGTVPPTINSTPGGTPAPPPLAVAGGKHLILSNSVLTRYNSDDTVDTTYGTGGSVSDFISGTSAKAFKAFTLVANGTEVFVVGEATVNNGGADMAAVGVAAVDANGHRVTSFGSDGLALDSNGVMNFGSPAGQINAAKLGPDGELYVGADQDENPILYRFDTNTGLNGAQFAPQGNGYDPGLLDFTFQADQKILVLTHEGGPILHLYRLNTDFTADSSFGAQGEFQAISTHGVNEPDSARGDALLVRSNGTIFVSGFFPDSQQSAVTESYFTFAYRSGTATVSVSSSNDSPRFGDSLDLTAHVASFSPTGPTPTGSVTFFADGASIGSAAIQSDGTATLTTTSLPVGIHDIAASYGGDATYAPTDPTPPLKQAVYQAPIPTTLTLTLSNIAPTVGDTVVLNVQMALAVFTAGTRPAITGTVTFFTDGVAFASVPLQAGEYATITTASFQEGTQVFTASYDGNSTYASAQSAPLPENVTPVSDFQAAASGSLPANVVAGSKTHIRRKVQVNTTGAFTTDGKVKFAWFLSNSMTVDSNAIALSTGSSKKLRVGQHKPVTFTANLNTIPASVPAGTYHLLLEVIDPRGGTSVSPSAGTIAVAAPNNELTGSFLKLPTSAKVGQKLRPTLLITNSGNAPAVGVLQFSLDASLDGSLGANPLQMSKAITIKPGGSMRIRMGSIGMPPTAGSYFLVAQVFQQDPSGSYADLHVLNGLIVSKKPIVVG